MNQRDEFFQEVFGGFSPKSKKISSFSYKKVLKLRFRKCKTSRQMTKRSLENHKFRLGKWRAETSWCRSGKSLWLGSDLRGSLWEVAPGLVFFPPKWWKGEWRRWVALGWELSYGVALEGHSAMLDQDGYASSKLIITPSLHLQMTWNHFH